MIKILPGKIPPLPNPAMARPTINAAEVGATPQIKEPSSKRKIATSKVHFTGYNVYSLPNKSVTEHMPRKYTLPYHPTSLIVLKSCEIFGMAVARIVLSCEES
jgi:hypothetical protein